MSVSKYEAITGNISTGNILHIKETGFVKVQLPVVDQKKCRKCLNILRASSVNCHYCGENRSNFDLETTSEVKSQLHKLGQVIFQTKINVYDIKKLTLFVGLQSQDKNVHDVCISSNSPRLCRFLKAKPTNEWHAIYNHNAVQDDINSWKFDLEVALVTENVNPLLNSILKDNNTTDVELIGVDGSVRAHGCVMAAASPFLRAAFYGDFAEARDKRLNVPDANVASLKLIKQYAYMGFVDAEPVMLATLLPLASRFLMTSLVHACAASLCELQPEDLIPLMQMNLQLTSTEEKEKEKPQPPLVVDNELKALNNIPETGADSKLEAMQNIPQIGAGDGFNVVDACELDWA